MRWTYQICKRSQEVVLRGCWLRLFGVSPFEIEEFSVDDQLELRTKIKLNVGFPTKSLADSMLPVDGVGLARIEFVLSSGLGIHPLAFVHYQELKDYSENGLFPIA